MTDYNDGKWHFWNGAKCPVHPESVVDMVLPSSVCDNDALREKGRAGYLSWEGGYNTPLMFRVTNPYREAITFTGECFAYHYASTHPALASHQVETSIPGKYTATHINGKLAKIVWEASE